MAYFEGNAIHIRGAGGPRGSGDPLDQEGTPKVRLSFLNLQISNNSFTRNHGPNIAFGAALAIDGRETEKVGVSTLP